MQPIDAAQPPFPDELRAEEEEFAKFWKGNPRHAAVWLLGCDYDKLNRLWEWSFANEKMPTEEALAEGTTWTPEEEMLYKIDSLYRKCARPQPRSPPPSPSS